MSRLTIPAITASLILLNILCGIFIAWTWWQKNDFLVNAGFLVLGALLTTLVTWFFQVLDRYTQRLDLARVLCHEVAHFASRCCFDIEKPWQAHWPDRAYSGGFHSFRLRKFAPEIPLIYEASVGKLGLLPDSVCQPLLDFYYRIGALRRDIENIADKMDNERSKETSQGESKLVAQRFGETLDQAFKTLEALETIAPGSVEIEERAKDSYYESRPKHAKETLRSKLRRLSDEFEASKKAAQSKDKDDEAT
jgi:hypothetical protein